MKYKFFKSNVLIIVIIAVIFGFGAGIVGDLFARVYLFSDLLNIPLYGEIDLTNNNNGNARFIIRDAKKVVVEQDKKINETIQVIENNIVGIFKKQIPHNSDTLYYAFDEVAQGIVLTSDGWIISDLTKIDISENNFDNYFIATNSGDVYELDAVVKDQYSSYSFLHIKDVRDLPVSQFVPRTEIDQGSSVMIFDWDKNSTISHISGKKQQKILSSDILEDELFLSDELKDKESLFVYNLLGQFLGFVNNEGAVYPIHNLESVISTILKDGDLRRVWMGIHYIDLEDYISPELELEGVQITKSKDGVSIVKNSPAELANLQDGDIIISIDNIKLNGVTKLNNIIQDYKKGDSINIIYIREGEKYNTNIILDEY